MKLIYRQHAIQRMFERGISSSQIEHALASGEMIEEYPDDKPFPSCLWLGTVGDEPVHVVFADNLADGERIIITVYRPDPEKWEDGFRKRTSS